MASAEETWVDDSLLVFDGRVLEVFGFSGSESIRFHVDNVTIDSGEPGRKGRKRQIRIAVRTRGGGGVALEVTDEAWVGLGPMLEAVRAAGSEPES